MFAGLYTDLDPVLNTMFDEDHDELVLAGRNFIPPANTTWWRSTVRAHAGYIPGDDGKTMTKIARSLKRRTKTKLRLAVPSCHG